MAFGRKRRQIEAMKHRIQDLEEHLCPCEGHEWVHVATDYKYEPYSVEAWHKYKCKRCGKEKWDWR